MVLSYKRHYHSDLSIWLSVDPMADKYPGVSPYTYCANNPVRLVDPDGRTWVSPEEDEAKYITLRAAAVNARDKYLKGSKKYNLIQEGIDGLDFMKEDTKNKYTFVEFYKDEWDGKKDEAGYVYIEGANPQNRTYYISYLHDNSGAGFTVLEQGEAWHEVAHLSRALISFCRPEYMKWKTGRTTGWEYIQTSGFSLTDDNCLGIKTKDKQYEEFMAYKSQMLVYPTSMPIPFGCISGTISTDEQINSYVKNNYPVPNE